MRFNNKTITILIIIAVAVIAIYFIYKFQLLNKGKEESCKPYLNITTIISSGDLKSCVCLGDSALIKQCEQNINDAISYTNALKQSSLSLCDNISALDIRNTCLRLVQGKIDFVNPIKEVSTTTIRKK